MKKRARALILLATSALFAVACDDDPARPPGEQTPRFLPLTSRSAVLNNLEAGWTMRRPDKVAELLDVGFTFYFDPGDVGGGIPPSWNRTDEMAATQALLLSNTPAHTTGPVCRSVRVDLYFDSDTIEWTEVPVPSSASGEVWYSATIFYAFTFEMEPDLTFVGLNGARAQLTVRPVGEEWRLVAWRDVGSGLAAGSARTDQSPTWGAIKALYR